MLFTSCSYASFATGVKEEFFTNINKLYTGGLISEDTKNNIFDYINNDNIFNNVYISRCYTINNYDFRLFIE